MGKNIHLYLGRKFIVQRPAHYWSDFQRCDLCLWWHDPLPQKYPDSVLTTELLGSDQNEQLFAFIRTSYAGGRSRNLDAATLAFGIENKNVRSELSLPHDKSVVAHTRGRTLMHPQFLLLLLRSLPLLSKIPPNRILLCGQERWLKLINLLRVWTRAGEQRLHPGGKAI